MWVNAVIMVVMSTLALFMLSGKDDEVLIAATESRTVAENMAVYRAAVVEFARHHPDMEGHVDEAALTGPAWWRPHPSLKAFVAGRLVMIYASDPAHRGLVDEMRRLSGGSLLVGTASLSGGRLHSPTEGDTGIELPALVPHRAPVWLSTRE